MTAPLQSTVQRDKLLLAPGASPQQCKRFKRAVARESGSGVSLNTSSLALIVVMIGAYSANAHNLQQHPKLNWIATIAFLVVMLMAVCVWILRLTELERLVKSGTVAQVPQTVWHEYVKQCEAVGMKPREAFDDADFPELRRVIKTHESIRPSVHVTATSYLQRFITTTLAQIVKRQQSQLNKAVSQLPGRVVDPAQVNDLSAEEIAQLREIVGRFPIQGISMDKSDN